MMLFESFDVALRAVRTNKLRAALTTLGIIIGVAAVITMVALGSGAQRAVAEQIDEMGAQILTIYPGQSRSLGVAQAERESLSSLDALALARESELISDVVPEIDRPLQVKYTNQNVNVEILGTTPNYLDVRNYRIASGRMFTLGDGAARRRYAVLGSELPEMLGQTPAAMLGQTIAIQSIPFEVIGVFAEKGSDGGWRNPDERVMIPLQTAQLRLFGTDNVRSIAVKIAEGVPVEQGMVELERILRRRHKIPPGEENDFRVRNRQEFLNTQQATTQIFTYLLASIAAVSLLVGGIGIMNIMLVSVTERTREIGIRKALGATRRNIMLQFLIESLLLCAAGGLLGIALGCAGAYALAELAGWNTYVSPPAVGVAFAFSAATGVVFGLWPARRAAALNPIDALRYE